MNGCSSQIKTNEKVVNALKAAAGRKMTAEELREQKASFIYGMLSADSGVTKAQIKEFVKEHEGV